MALKRNNKLIEKQKLATENENSGKICQKFKKPENPRLDSFG